MQADLFGLAAVAVVMVAVVWLTGARRWPAFLVIYLASVAIGLCLGTRPGDVIGHAIEGFGKMVGQTAILIVSGIAIGELLGRMGVDADISQRLARAVGGRRLPLASAASGYLLAVPLMCCDTAFLVLSPVVTAMGGGGGRTARAQALLLACAAGAYTSFKMVAPSPGPLALISGLGADFALTMLLGAALSVPVLAAGLVWVARSRRPEAELPLSATAAGPQRHAPQAATPRPDARQAVGAPRAAAPTGAVLAAVALPLALIAARSVLRPAALANPGIAGAALDLIGHPAVAMPVAAGLTAMIASRLRTVPVEECIAQAVRRAGSIILVVGAGGALGGVLGHTALPARLGALLARTHLPGLLVPFLVASVIKTVQGSSLVSLTTAPAIVAPLLPALRLSPEVAALSVMAGALAVVHVNDSYFWLVTRTLDMDVTQGYRTLTAMTLIQSLVALAGVVVISLLL